MTTKQDKQPDPELNSNCLEGYACPCCGSTGPFNIVGTALFLDVDDDGTASFENAEWDDNNGAVCTSCHFSGILLDFKIGEPRALVKFVFERERKLTTFKVVHLPIGEYEMIAAEVQRLATPGQVRDDRKSDI